MDHLKIVAEGIAPPEVRGKVVDAAAFEELLVSHRRMERLNHYDRHLRGLRDLETGEVLLTEARRLLDLRR